MYKKPDKAEQELRDQKFAQFLDDKQDKYEYYVKDIYQYEEEHPESTTDSEIVETNTINSNDDEQMKQKKLDLQELDRKLKQEKIDRDLAVKLQEDEDRKEMEEVERKQRLERKRKGENPDNPIR